MRHNFLFKSGGILNEGGWGLLGDLSQISFFLAFIALFRIPPADTGNGERVTERGPNSL